AAPGIPALSRHNIQIELIRHPFRQGEEEAVRGLQVGSRQLLEVGEEAPGSEAARVLEAPGQERGLPHLPRALQEHQALAPPYRLEERGIRLPLHVERRV